MMPVESPSQLRERGVRILPAKLNRDCAGMGNAGLTAAANKLGFGDAENLT
jgi:hypothetical protein